jgi:CRP-like cAMP-binding protein
MQYRDPFIELCIEGPNSIFRGLSPAEKEMVDKHHVLQYFRKGEVIVNEGKHIPGLICLATGKAKVFSIGAGGREQIIRMLKPQNIISFGSLFSEHQYSFTVTTIEDSTIVIFKKQPLSRIIRQNSDLALKFIKIISNELLASNQRLISLTQKHVRGRIAETLLMLRELYGVEIDGKTLKVCLTRDDIAHLSNMTTSNAIRTLSNFSSEGFIILERRKIMIIDKNKLEEISGSGQ